MFSLKFKNLRWKDNHIRYIFLTIAIALILAFNIYGIAATILCFILISFILSLMGSKNEKKII